MTRMLVSVRSVAEALVAAQGGADFIDLKEPNFGALGGLPVETIAAVVAALRQRRIVLPVSATIGDLPMSELAAIVARVRAVAACGVSYVKVGIERTPQALAVLDALAALAAPAAGSSGPSGPSSTPIVPVFIADHGLDDAHVAHACALRFAGLMVDTADKTAGSVFDVLRIDALRRFIGRVRDSGALAGMAGALRLAHVPAVRSLAPDFAGFRSAVCAGDRRGVLDPQLLRELAEAMHASEPAAVQVGANAAMAVR